MADGVVAWARAQCMRPVDPNEKLFLFGYSCKIFRDDEKALYIDQGKHLIPWMGDESLMIDRYDVRGYLHDLKQYEPKPGENYDDPMSEEEKLCDEERYRALRSDVSEEQLYQEEELKRLRAAIAGDGAYHEIAFSYDGENEKYVEPEATKVEEPEDELYQVPKGLQVPKGMERPYNMKIHAIIEKTALFVSEQGGQMEIIIKMKQHANPQFAFMHLDNPLYPYYKHLVKEIKSGAYKPVQVKKVSRSEDEDEDGHYLHPSLMAGKAEDVPKFTVPTINFRRSYDDSYSVLVRNLQQHVTEETPQESPEQSNESNSCAPENNHLVSYYNDGTNADDDESHNEEQTDAVQTIVPPPPDIQPIIHKMAEYVAKNGGDFEFIVKSKNDKRFAFLQPGNEYYNYYVQKRDEAKLQLSGNTVSNDKNVSSNTPPSSDNKAVACSSESAPVSTVVPSEIKNEESITPAAKEEYNAIYSQESQDGVLTSEPAEQETNSEVKYDEQTDSMDFLDSPGTPRSIKEEAKVKCKVLKGPISFSLKTKDSDAPASDKPKTMTFLMDDSEEDSSDETRKEKESNKRRKSVDETTTQPNSRQNSVEREEKIPKLSNEVLEAKLAEERLKDKLLAAARERLAQQKKEKQLLMEQQKREEQLKKEKQMFLDEQRKERQLQLERKRKAALFLKMLEKRNPNSNADSFQKTGNDKKDMYDRKSGKASSKSDSDFWVLPDTSNENGLLFPARRINISATNLPISIPGIKTAWSSNSNTEESGEEEFITTYGSDSEPSKSVPPPPPSPPPPPPPVVKHEHKKKKKKHSRSKSRERSRTDRSKSSKSREKARSRSPRSHKLEKFKKDKEKELPAAYAFSNRSRSRSPRRYRPNQSHWNRRR